jgi:ribonuclease P protein component
VLSPEHRLRRRTEFSDVVRRGRRASRPTLTVHLLDGAEDGVRAGFVVSKAVGGSVVRSQVSRRLRHQLRAVVPALPAGCRLVVRAAPAAADADSARIGADLRAALTRLGHPA